ncbi:NADPH-dependent FMN reductase [Metabacillus fastidiosus]|uniref:NADPH-dependent FMN reductase n=1 Tax=Metabacillus fastidiosus TaxID=1458 RepID=A0ABU6NW83_9BACI|nr:NADPH-dependent FMN reductase [Metabacillus fastidiosus]MED4401385.1 NADPH-dependent FMN reductase [Metabacillus fastidiosus]MED4463021.1 NADPH-dependent FMN reductase [Metabacillus fastidiosus]
MTNVAIIIGTPSEHSRLNGILSFALNFLEGKNVNTEIVNVRDIPAEDLIYAKFDSPAIIEANKKVENADLVIILTPVYKAAYTGVLKTYLDLLPQKALVNKTILPLVIGGTFGHLLVIDYAIKPVLNSLGATNILNGAYVIDQQVERLENNEFSLDKEVEERLEKQLTLLISK